MEGNTENDPVIARTQKLIISGVPHVAALTATKLLLSDPAAGELREEIPFTSIRLASPGESSIREPTISLAIAGPEGEVRSLDLIFIHTFGGLNEQERDRCLALLKEHGVPVPPAHESEMLRVSSGAPAPGTGSQTAESNHIPAQEWMPSRLPVPRKKIPVVVPERTPFPAIAAIVIIIIAIAGIAFGVGQLSKGTVPAAQVPPVPSPISSPVPSPLPTSAPVTVIPEPVETTPAPEQTPPATGTPEFIVPPTGVWVRIDYPGNYTGSVGAKGRFTQVNATGGKLIHIPEASGMIEGAIGKQDGSASALSIEVFRDGTLLSATNTTKPFGVAEIHVSF